MLKPSQYAFILCLGLFVGSVESRGDVMFTFPEVNTGEGIYASYPGPITQHLSVFDYSGTPDLPQLDPISGISFALSGVIGNITLLPATGNGYATSWYADQGLEDPRYGQSTYEGTWSMFHHAGVVETGTFSILFTYEPEFPGFVVGDLITSAEGTFIAAPGSVLVPGFGHLDLSTHNPLHFSGGVSIWGNLSGTLTGQPTSQTVVPEPASVGLIGVGLLAMLGRQAWSRRHG